MLISDKYYEKEVNDEEDKSDSEGDILNFGTFAKL